MPLLSSAAFRGQGRVRHSIPVMLLAMLVSAAIAAEPAGTTAGHGPPPAFATHGAVPALRTAAELEALVAPVALYPDELLAIVLPAAAWPHQIAQAAQFLAQRTEETPGEPDPAWDANVVALLGYPEVVARLDHELDWTARLGAAVIHQQDELLAAVAAFRERAYASGNLVSDERQAVTRESGVLSIQPAAPDVVYVPYYQPSHVVVQQQFPALYYYPHPRLRPAPLLSPWAGFGPAWGVAPAFAFSWSRYYSAPRERGYGRRWQDGRTWRDGARRPGRGRDYDSRDYRRSERSERRRDTRRSAVQQAPSAAPQAASGPLRGAAATAPRRNTAAGAGMGPRGAGISTGRATSYPRSAGAAPSRAPARAWRDVNARERGAMSGAAIARHRQRLKRD